MVSMKGHPMITLELASRCRRINSHGYEVGAGQLAFRRLLYGFTESPNQLWSLPLFLQGMAARTGAIPSQERVAGRRKILNILRPGFPGGTGGPAEDARRFDSHAENALEGGVSIHQGSIHGLVGWKFVHEAIVGRRGAFCIRF
jgi:hypothetical protein